MSASPVAESFEKLYSMMRVLDCGERLGRTKEGFLNKHFFALDFKGYRWQLKGGAEEEILDKINDVLYVVESDKHETLPPVVEGYQYFDMSPEAADAYAVMKRDMLLELSGSAAVAPNKAVASGKMRQIASGFIVDEYEEVHDFDELRAHAVWVWAAALQGRQGVILYQYNHQRVQLRRVLADQAVYAYGGSDKAVALAKFKAKDFQLLVAQERVLSHGIDGLQDVCSDMLFMQPPWSADTKIQAIGRLHRTGQKHTTNITTLMANKSLDSLVEDRQTSKAEHMKNFLTHLRQQ
jgi:hypothetical protein